MKKILFIFFSLAVFKANAQQIEWVRHGLYGIEQIVVKFAPEKSIMFTNTNAFDSRYPAMVGFFERKKIGPNYKIVESYLKPESEKKFIARNKIAVSPHNPKLYFNGKEVPLGSIAYAELGKVLRAEAADTSWTFTEGNRVAFKNFRELTVEDWKTKKKLFQKKRMPTSVCKRAGPDVLCRVKSGMVYAPAEFEKFPFSTTSKKK